MILKREIFFADTSDTSLNSDSEGEKASHQKTKRRKRERRGSSVREEKAPRQETDSEKEMRLVVRRFKWY